MVRMLLLGVALAWAAGLLFAGAVSVANPWFVDSLAWFAVLFGGLAGAGGLLLGLAMLPLRRVRVVARAARRVPVLLAVLAACGLALWGWSSSHGYDVRDERPKVVVIGLDGATYDIIDPMIADGRLPGLARLIREGAAGELISIEPTISPALWTTLATGKLRSEHGVINFRSLQSDLRVKRFWDVAHAAGLEIGVMDWLVTWPPLIEDGGFWVPSHMARGAETLPVNFGFLQQMLGATRDTHDATATDRITWGIDALLSGLRLSTLMSAVKEVARGTAASDDTLARSHRLQHLALNIYRDLFLALRAEYRPDVSAVVFYGTDSLAHKYWRYFEPEAFPGTDPEDVEKYGRVIPDYYEAADRAIDEIAGTVDENTTIVLISDHGSQAMEGGAALRMPRLAGQSLVESLGVAEYVDVTGIGNQTIITPKAGAGGASRLQTVADLLRRATLDGVEAEPFVVDLIDKDGDAGDYVGVVFNLATRLVDDDAFEATLHFPNGKDVVLADIVASEFRVSGGHHLRGIVVLHGRGVHAGKRIENASLPDVAPTVLYLLGLPVALDMDGRVLIEGLRAEFAAAHPVHTVTSHGGFEHGDAGGAARPMTPQLEERLRALGYLGD